MKYRITSKDISVVIQGPIDIEVYERTARSIRDILPESEIVLSTWENTNINGLDFDKIVINDDPGQLELNFAPSVWCKVLPYKSNINRQIVSTKNGLLATDPTKAYVMKLRSDSIVVADTFLKYASKYLKDSSKVCCFEPVYPYGRLAQYQLSDFWFFGSRTSMIDLWNIPLYKKRTIDITTEEYLVEKLIGKKGVTGKDFIRLLREKIVVIPARKSGILSLKYPQYNSFTEVCVKHYKLTYSDWRSINHLGGGYNIVSRIGSWKPIYDIGCPKILEIM